MSSLLSVLVTKDPTTSAVNLFKTDSKSLKKDLVSCDKGCTAFIETIADLDQAHFITMYEMQDLVTKISGMEFKYPPRDRLVAAKALAKALSDKQKELPGVPEKKDEEELHARVCLPSSEIIPSRKGTKLALFVELLIKGSTVSEMVKASGQAVGGVLSSINYDLHRRKGVGYRITKKNGEDFYKIVLPVGFKGQLIV